VSCFATLQRQFRLYIPFLGIARPQPQFPHSCVCERFIYSQDRSTYFLQQKRQTHRGNYIIRSQTLECGNGTEAPIFLFWEYLFQIFGILSLQCRTLQQAMWLAMTLHAVHVVLCQGSDIWCTSHNLPCNYNIMPWDDVPSCDMQRRMTSHAMSGYDDGMTYQKVTCYAWNVPRHRLLTLCHAHVMTCMLCH
jgi:hypothetical protein